MKKTEPEYLELEYLSLDSNVAFYCLRNIFHFMYKRISCYFHQNATSIYLGKISFKLILQVSKMADDVLLQVFIEIISSYLSQAVK